MTKHTLILAVLAAVAAWLVAAQAPAGTITVTQTGTASGTIGATQFTNADFTITLVGDTNNRTVLNQGQMSGYQIPDDSASISIQDVGVFQILSPTNMFNNTEFGAAGLTLTNVEDLYDEASSSVFSSWNMLTSFGPISDTAYLLQQYDPWSQVQTTGGEIQFTMSETPSVYEASVTPVPEPDTPALLCAAFLGLGGLLLLWTPWAGVQFLASSLKTLSRHGKMAT
jgi:hypothetical protein